MSVGYTYQNLMLHNCYSNQLSTDCYYGDVMCHGTSSQAINQDQYSQNSTIPQCTPSPLLRRKISSLLPPIVTIYLFLCLHHLITSPPHHLVTSTPCHPIALIAFALVLTLILPLTSPSSCRHLHPHPRPCLILVLVSSPISIYP